MAQKPEFDPESGEILDTAGDGTDTPRTLFATFIQNQRDGLLHSELTEEFAELVQACLDLNKGGSLTLKIAVEPSGKNQATIFVKDEVKVKRPEDRPKSLFFSDGRGNVSRRDPNQMQFAPGQGPREVPAPDAPRDIPPKEEK